MVEPTGVLDRKVAIVTGSSRGIGKAIAIEYAAEGARVVVSSRTPGAVQEVVDQIRGSGGEALACPCDVGDPDQIERLVDVTVDAFGRIDVLVNNAQSFGTRESPRSIYRDHPIEEFPEDEWDWTFETGVKATLRTMKAVFPHMRDRGGRIINFGSRRGVVGGEHTAAYNANKEAIRALTRTAAREWGLYGITVNVVNPAVETDASRAHYAQRPGYREAQEANTPLGRIGNPRECARVAVFLAGEDSSYLTGMTFYVDGGLSIGA